MIGTRPTVSALATAVMALKRYHTTSGRNDLLTAAANESVTNVSSAQVVLDLLIDTLEGGYTTAELISKIDQYISEDQQARDGIADLIKIFYQGGDRSYVSPVSLTDVLSEEVNKNPSSSSKESPAVSLIQSNDINVMPANHNADSVVLLLTAVPTHEISRCVPYLNIEVITQGQNDPSDRVVDLSIYKFLGGTYRADGVEGTMISSVFADLSDSDNSGATHAAMELFTSPQTMVAADESKIPGGRLVPIIDPFRPFMSIRSFKVDLAETTGWFSNKTAKLNIVLHDRTRLADISDFIRPDTYSQAELIIEYGWSHPDGDPASGNVYGQLLNSSRVKEKFNIVTSTFEFTTNGQVNIEMNLALKGAPDTMTTTIGADPNGISVIREIKSITEAISKMNSTDPNWLGQAEVRPTLIIDTASDVSKSLMSGTDLSKQLKQYLSTNQNNKNPSVQQFLSSLRTLYGSDGTNGLVEQAKNTIADIVAEKINSLLNGIDPILNPSNLTGTDQTYPTDKRRPGRRLVVPPLDRYVSLGKLLLQFLARPIAATNKYDDIQLLFYVFNSHAGAMHGKNISEFPIKIGAFKAEFENLKKSRATTALTLYDFVTWINTTFLADQSNPSFGLSDLYDTANADNQVKLHLKQQLNDDTTAMKDQMSKILEEKCDIHDGKFNLPTVQMYFETVPGAQDTRKSILRIHIFDKVAVSYESLSDLLGAQKKDAATLIAASISDDSQSKAFANMIDDAFHDGIIKKVDGDVDPSKTVYVAAATQNKIKEFVARRVPTIRFGSTATGIKSAVFKSQADQGLFSANMMRIHEGTGFSVQGADANAVPMFIQPVQLSLDTIGCPLINFMQEFFVDFDTGTTVDNIYSVGGVSHEISRGKFSTDINLVPADAYGEFRSMAGAIQAQLAKTSAQG